MAKKKNKIGTYLLGFGLAFLLVGVASKFELPTTNTNSSSNVSLSISNSTSIFEDKNRIFTTLDTSNISVSSLTQVSKTSSSFVYRDLTLFENSKISKIGLPIKSLTDYSVDNTFSIFLIEQDFLIENYIELYELKINANTYNSNNVNRWVYFDVDINIDDGQTLAIGSSTDSINIGCTTSPLLGDEIGSVKNKVMNGVSGDEKDILSKIFIDFIKS